ncbi:MAG: N-acetylmuramoyl-L-alanine amidase [Bacteroidia bacterium]|nr:N-acetylmuramoyl-L-alanine amidase [Bacteroidia bacterium]
MTSEFKIVADWLSGTGVSNEFRSTKNRQEFEEGDLDTIVLHYTAGGEARTSASFLASDHTKVSAHLIIGRDGGIFQLIPFNMKAWHAGKSEHQGRVGMNRYSLGITMDNAGILEQIDQYYRSWFGGRYTADKVVYEKHHNHNHLSYWHKYTDVQISTCETVCKLLVDHYNLKFILGHDEVAPERKTDPGPAFPIAAIRQRIFGKEKNPIPAPIARSKARLKSVS